jgi:hypothetical protein
MCDGLPEAGHVGSNSVRCDHLGTLRPLRASRVALASLAILDRHGTCHPLGGGSILSRDSILGMPGLEIFWRRVLKDPLEQFASGRHLKQNTRCNHGASSAFGSRLGLLIDYPILHAKNHS